MCVCERVKVFKPGNYLKLHYDFSSMKPQSKCMQASERITVATPWAAFRYVFEKKNKNNNYSFVDKILKNKIKQQGFS